MKNNPTDNFSKRIKLATRLMVGFFLICITMATAGLLLIIQTKEMAFEDAVDNNIKVAPRTFPVGIDPRNKTITEISGVEDFLYEETGEPVASKNIWQRVTALLVNYNWYQNLASANTRILVIWPGERKEQIAKNFANILDWNQDEQELFAILVSYSAPNYEEGKFFPDTYVIPKDSSPENIAQLVTDRFNNEVLARFDENNQKIVSLEETLTIASMLEREAYDFTDMRIISGIIWNRLFINMPLQLDATLQYAKANSPYERKWWPQVKPRDKYIDSPYNTYKNTGLPPAPIANPSLESILAALNPKQTDCLFYFHDSNSGFHCSETYEGHVELLKEHYGQGR